MGVCWGYFSKDAQLRGYLNVGGTIPWVLDLINKGRERKKSAG